MKLLFAAAMILSILTTQASAQWVHQEHGSAFDSQRTQLALTTRGQYAVGLRCTSATDLTVVYITSEAVDSSTLANINMAAPEVLVRIDQNDPFTLPATAELIDGNLSLLADAPVEIANQLITASATASVAVRMLGQIYHETAFNVRGSTASVTTLFDRCSLSEARAESAPHESWQTFARFHGYVLTIEDQCSDYSVLTDAVMGNHLSGRDYDRAMAELPAQRAAMRSRVTELGCDAAAVDAAEMMGKSMEWVWGTE